LRHVFASPFFNVSSACAVQLVVAIHPRAYAAAEKRAECCASDRRNRLAAAAADLVPDHAAQDRSSGYADVLFR
jgi:hypothetical protein